MTIIIVFLKRFGVAFITFVTFTVFTSTLSVPKTIAIALVSIRLDSCNGL